MAAGPRGGAFTGSTAGVTHGERPVPRADAEVGRRPRTQGRRVDGRSDQHRRPQTREPGRTYDCESGRLRQEIAELEVVSVFGGLPLTAGRQRSGLLASFL